MGTWFKDIKEKSYIVITLKVKMPLPISLHRLECVLKIGTDRNKDILKRSET